MLCYRLSAPRSVTSASASASAQQQQEQPICLSVEPSASFASSAPQQITYDNNIKWRMVIVMLDLPLHPVIPPIRPRTVPPPPPIHSQLSVEPTIRADTVSSCPLQVSTSRTSITLITALQCLPPLIIPRHSWIDASRTVAPPS